MEFLLGFLAAFLFSGFSVTIVYLWSTTQKTTRKVDTLRYPLDIKKLPLYYEHRAYVEVLLDHFGIERSNVQSINIRFDPDVLIINLYLPQEMRDKNIRP